MTNVKDLYPAFIRGACRFCGRVNEDNPGDFYHGYDCEKRFLRDCILRETDKEIIRQLEKRLDNLTCGD